LCENDVDTRASMPLRSHTTVLAFNQYKKLKIVIIWGTYKVRNEMETKRNENKTK